MKRIELCFIMIMLFSILCGCANPNNNSNESAVSSAAASLQDDETSLQIPSDTTEPESTPLNIEYGRFYNCWDEEYLEVIYTMQDSLVQILRERNLHFKEDVENGVIPEVLQFEYCGTVYDLKLNSEKYTNMSSWFCPEVSYYDNTTGLIIDVDADTLGERYMWLRARSLANSLHNESAYEKTSDELVSIAKDYIGPRLAKLNLNDSDYHIIIQEPNAGRPHYALSFVLDIPLLGISPIVSMTMDSFGFIQTVTMRGNILLDSDFVARLPAIDEEALLYEADNRFREAHCDCDLSVSYRVFQREYNGELYAELQCGIIPSVKNPDTHHHDYANNSFCTFLKLNE